MGVDTRPPLPAATESWADNGNEAGDITASDLATDVSRRTDRTSYSIPEDGSPIVVPVKASKSERRNSKGRGADQSQTSLLIEYFEATKKGEQSTGRPSVRVKVTPHAKKSQSGDAVKVTEVTGRTPSYSRTIPLNSKSASRAAGPTSPVEVELLNPSEDSYSSVSRSRYIEPTSEISSMPADSMLEGPVTIQPPEHEDSRGIEQDDVLKPGKMDTLRTPSQRQRSLSRERITQKVIEKLGQESGERKRSSKHSERGLSQDLTDRETKSSRRRSSKSNGDSDRYTGSAESSLLSARGQGSNISGMSKSSINNPKLLATVEDAIRRLILPEIETMKREQSIHYNREKFDRGVRGLRDSTGSDAYTSRDATDRKLAKASSEPRLKPKVVLNRDENNPGTTLADESSTYKKTRKSSRGSTSSSRRDSLDSSRQDEKSYRRKTGERSTGEKALAAGAIGVIGGVLTAAALKQHDSRSSQDLRDSSEKRKRRSKSRSRSNSIVDSEGEEYIRQIPPMPMRSAMQDSDLTRDSILSAETERPPSRDSRGTHTPVREVGRSSPRVVPLPKSREGSKTPSSSRRGSAPRETRSPAVAALYSPRSNRSISSKAKEAGLAAAGLGAGAAAATTFYKHEEDHKQNDRGLRAQEGNSRGVSPVQSAASYQDVSPSLNRDSLITNEELPSPASSGKHFEDSPINTSRDVAYDKLDTGFHSDDDMEDPKAASLDAWYDEQHKVNDQYRNSGDYSHRDSGDLDYRRLTHISDDGSNLPYEDGQSFKGVGANPQYVGTPVGVESAVASILEPSMVSSRSDHQISFLDSPGGESQNLEEASRDAGGLYHEQDNLSAERWKDLKDNARNLTDQQAVDREYEASPRQSIAESIESEPPKMSANAMPTLYDPLPAVEHVDDTTDITTNPSIKDRDSIVRETLADPNEPRSHWPIGDTPPNDKRRGYVGPLDRDSQAFGASKADVFGTAAGLGIGAAAANKFMDRTPQSTGRADMSTGYNARNLTETGDMYKGGVNQPTPQTLKDEGYMSGQPQSPPTQPKLASYAKPPQLFDESDMADDRDVQEEDPFTNNKRIKYLSGNSHGMASPLYDASTGRGINNIQSKDVVALMDHLTVRDGQRSARDTEILVTLVRSAAEMRNSFDEIKKFIGEQQMATKRADVGPDRGAQRNLSGMRNSISPRSRATSTADSLPAKKKNIFQRALKGLGSRSTDDLARIEDMLNQLLDEVEDLKSAQGLPVQRSAVPKAGSLDSYERLRAAPESGYEPEGQAGTSTPNQSGYSVSSPLSRQAPQLRSGYGRRESENRVSTVMEGDEDLEDHENYVLEHQFENGERLLTPTQEAMRSGNAYDTPTRAINNDITPRTTERSRKHRSNGSSVFAIPKISRWSKTTTSSIQDNRSSMPPDGQYSEASRSGSEVNVLPGEGPYDPSGDDRLRSQNSLNNDPAFKSDPVPRSASPLIPDASLIDDPKYQANRHSLTLEHPQPRPGPTHRHQSHLESQAYQYNTPMSPASDTFGSVPSLARLPGQGYAGNRLSAGSGMGNLSPISSEGAYSEKNYSQQYAPPRPPKVIDSGPLVPPVPPKVLPPSASVSVKDHANDPGVSPEDDYEMQYDPAWDDPPPQIERKRSPYSPGALLPPIEERYSMELERSATPTLNARPALGAGDTGMRKLTGPREMPGSGARKADVKRYSGDSETF